MYNLSCICFMCLTENKNFTTLHPNDAEYKTTLQVKHVLPELTISELGIPVHICSPCHSSLQSFHEFKAKCLENYNLLKNYIKTTQETSHDQPMKCVENNNDKSTEEEDVKEETEDPLLLLERRTSLNNFTPDSISIKEEIIESDSDYSIEEVEDCHPFQFIKCEVSDDGQDSGPSNVSGRNSQNESVFLTDSDEFQCSICNEKFPRYGYLKEHMRGAHAGVQMMPKKSAERYNNEYRLFLLWKKECHFTDNTEDVILAYMEDMAKKMSSSSLWSKYSMVKCMLLANENVDISSFSKVTAFIKQLRVGYQANQSKALTRDEVYRFMKDAPDNEYLLAKGRDNFSHFSDSDCDPEYRPSSTENSEDEYASENNLTVSKKSMTIDKGNRVSQLRHRSFKSIKAQKSGNKKIRLNNTESSEDEYLSENNSTDFEESMSLDEANCISTKAPSSTNNSEDACKTSSTVPEKKLPLVDSNCVSKSSNELQEAEKDKNKKIRPKRRLDFCLFCQTDVYNSNFARHLFRNHSAEVEVQELLSFPVKNKKRNNLLRTIRKKGNYLKNAETGRPVKTGTVATSYLPCTHCLGFYSAKNLWRHRQQCSANPDKEGSMRGTQSLAQTMQLGNVKVDPELKEKIFPHMRADKISLVAKKDPLICAFGARYLKTHPHKHFVAATSQKMRSLAKLLLEIKNRKPCIQNLFSCLKPQYFDLLISATKSVSAFNSEKKWFKSALATNMGTTLKQCCDIAFLHALKEKDIYGNLASAETKSDLTTLTRLLQSNWKFEISRQDYNDLQSNRLNKVSIVPLATDLKLLKDYLLKNATEAVNSLNEYGASEANYNKLLQTVFCRLVFLNRKRPGELQTFLLRTYEDSLNTDETKTDENISEVITESEKALMKPFKRLIIKGTKGKRLAVLFSQDIQDHIKILLQHRSTIMQKPNIYLFGNPKNSEPIVGYKILKKYAAECGAKNPEALTFPSLRKHLAILTQLFNLTQSDMEQFSNFMRNTLSIHKSSNRPHDDVYQTAKVGKLLTLMDQGMAGKFKGKTLDEIDVNMDEDLMINIEEDTYDGDESDVEENCETINKKDEDVLPTKTKNKASLKNKSSKKGTKRVLVPWTEEQRTVTCVFFKKHIRANRAPKRNECEILISQHPDLFKNKDWLKIKAFIQSKYSRKMKL